MTSTESDIHQAIEAAHRERSLQTLADNAGWLEAHRDQTVRAAASDGQPSRIDQAPKIGSAADAGQAQQ